MGRTAAGVLRGAVAVLLTALVAGLLTGSGASGVRVPARPPSADDVDAAVRALRDAGTGRYEAVLIRMLPGDTDANVWHAEYDLARPAYHATMESRSTRGPAGFTAELVGETPVLYARRSVWAAEDGDTWRRFDWNVRPYGWVRDLLAAGLSPHLFALLAFRVPDVTAPAGRDGDSWVVRGTLPRAYALYALGLYEDVPRKVYRDRITARGYVPADLVLGPDHRVRELRVDGALVALDYELLPELYEAAHATVLTMRVTDIGAPVAIRTPSPDEIVQ